MFWVILAALTAWAGSFWQKKYSNTYVYSLTDFLLSNNVRKKTTLTFELQSVTVLSYLMMVGMTSAVKRMQREAVAWEENSPSTEKTVMAVSLRSGGKEGGKVQ